MRDERGVFRVGRALIGAVMAWSFIGPASAGLFDKGPPEPILLSAQTDPAQAFKLLLDDGAALRHISKPYSGPSKTVAIGTVRLNFVTDASATATVKEFMGKNTATFTSSMKLLGVTPEMMKAVADRFAADLREALTARGYEVVPQAKLLENADYRSAIESTPPTSLSPMGAVTSVYATGTGDIGGFGMRNFAYYQKMPVVIANITLNFAAFDKKTNRWDLDDGGQAAISAEVKARVVSTVAGSMRVMTEDGGGAIYEFVRPLNLPSGIAERIERKAKSGGSIAAGLLAAVLTPGNASDSASYDVTAIQDYQQAASADLKLLAPVVANVLQSR